MKVQVGALALIVSFLSLLPCRAEPLQGHVQSDGTDIRHPSFSYKASEDHSMAELDWRANLPVQECEAKVHQLFFSRLKLVAISATNRWQADKTLPLGFVEADVQLFPTGAKISSLTGTRKLQPTARACIESIPAAELASATSEFGSLTVHISYIKK